jgi:hypothetical protein
MKTQSSGQIRSNSVKFGKAPPRHRERMPEFSLSALWLCGKFFLMDLTPGARQLRSAHFHSAGSGDFPIPRS